MSEQYKFLQKNNQCYIIRGGDFGVNITQFGNKENYIKVHTGVQYGKIHFLNSVKNKKHYLVNSIELNRLLSSIGVTLDIAITTSKVYTYSYQEYKEQNSKNAIRRRKTGDKRNCKITKDSSVYEWSKNTKDILTEKSPIYENIVLNYLDRNGFNCKTQEPFRIESNIFFADIYIPKKRVVVEVDGGYHKTKEQTAKDKKRDKLFNSIKIKTFRINNKETLNEYNLNILVSNIRKHKVEYNKK